MPAGKADRERSALLRRPLAMRNKIAISLLGLLVVSLPELAAQQARSSSEGPRAVVVEAVHDFGTIDQGATVSHSFTIRNDGTAPLTVSKIELSQPGMRSRFGRAILPGAQGRITIEWDVTRMSGEVTAEAVVHLDDPGHPRVTLAIKGTITPPIDIRPAPAIFFSVYRDEIVEQAVTIVNNEERPLRIEAIRPEGEHFLAELKTIESGRIYEVRVKVPRGMSAGRYIEELQVDTDHPRRRQLRIGVNVFVKNDLYAAPESVAFDEVTIDQLRRPMVATLLGQSVIVRKRQGQFRITDISTDVRGLRIDRSPSSAESSAAFRIDIGLEPDKVQPGSLDGSIRISTDDKEFPELAIPVKGIAK
jgi:uncharacterized protein DUF1573